MLQLVGCSHHNSTLDFREKLAFTTSQVREALDAWRRIFPGVEAVFISTCNRVEIYLAAENASEPGLEQIVGFLARFHHLDMESILAQVYHHCDAAAVKHLFTVAASIDSMVLGEPQILAQVKDAYELATQQESTGPLLHAVFQSAIRVARRVANETAIHQRRVSVPSVAVADFARQIFERFDDKHVVVIGAGEMAQETLRYLRDEGAHQITVINRSYDRASELAANWQGRAVAWDQLAEALATSDIVISTTSATEPIITLANFGRIERARFGRPLFVLDLAVPRDFDPAVGDRPDVYLYSIDDLEETCLRNRKERDRELPAALRIIEQETARFLGDISTRAVGPVIQQLREGWQKPKEEELERLLHKLPNLDDRAKEEIRQSFDRLVNKLLHPPLASLRDESRKGVPRTLLDALARLFQLKD